METGYRSLYFLVQGFFLVICRNPMLVFGAHKYIWSRLFVFTQSLFAFSLISSLTSYSTFPALALAAWTAVSFASSPDFWPCQIFDTWNKNVPWKLLLKIMEPCHTFDTWDRNLVICTLTRNGELSKNSNLNKWKWKCKKVAFTSSLQPA